MLESLLSLFIKMILQHMYFPVNIAKFLRTLVLKSIVKIEGVKDSKVIKGIFRSYQTSAMELSYENS